MSATNATIGQIPIADGNGQWAWGGNYSNVEDQLNRIKYLQEKYKDVV